MTLRPLLLAALVAPTAASAQASSLGDDPTITEGLITAAIVWEIGRVCDTLDAKRVQGLGFLLSLQAHARSLGFSQEEVTAYIENKEEKARLEAIALERAVAMGVVEGQPETYCAVGRSEIARGSQIGRYLTEG